MTDAFGYAGLEDWFLELRYRAVPGVGEDEVKAVIDANIEYEEFVLQNRHLLCSNWQDVAVEREAQALAKFEAEGKKPPASRVSEVEKAMRERPAALVRARALREKVLKLDRAALNAFHREAPKVLPVMREQIANKLDEAEAALAAFGKVAAEANELHQRFTQLRIAVERPTQTVLQSWQLALLDTQAGNHYLSEALKSARRRVQGPRQYTEDGDIVFDLRSNEAG